MRVARVIVDVALDREFDYRVPESFAEKVQIGSRVIVPFGRSRQATGYVIGLDCHAAPSVHALKDIQSLQGEGSYLSGSLLKLARWMAEYYCAPVEMVLRTLLPGAVRRHGARFKQSRVVFLQEGEREERLTPKQTALVAVLQQAGGRMPQGELLGVTGSSSALVALLVKKGVLRVESEISAREPLSNRTVLPTQPLTLTAEQAEALERIRACIRETTTGLSVSGTRAPGHVVLLHGVTGSGKTEVYLQAIQQVLDLGKGAIVLVPEIALTPQTVERFLARFGDRVAVLHSHLSDGERHDEWYRIRDGRARIVIGARSAVFAPLPDLGLLVVDEEHEPSYKQEEAPRYNARDVAVMRGVLEGCAVVLGSATPALESWWNAQSGKYRLATLKQRVDDQRMPTMRIVDLRIEAEQSGRVSVFSHDLLDSIRRRLDRGEQTMLFLNRRGFASSLLCPKCGYVSQCPNCSVAHTYHRKEDLLRCHICGGELRAPGTCPGCASPAFRFAGVGTERVEEIARKCFPAARVQRMDADTTTEKHSYDQILGDFRSGKIDILIGTQMIAKGLHFPRVTLVGVIYADLSLHMPDFRASERTFQLLAQVAGRAGRGDVAGEVVVQTFTPFHPAIQAARTVDFGRFMDQELEFRRELQYPPFSHLICLTLKGISESRVAFCADTLARELKERMPKTVLVSDAAPAPLAKAKGHYRHQVLMRSGSVRRVTEILRGVWDKVRLPPDVRCTVDVDAMNLF